MVAMAPAPAATTAETLAALRPTAQMEHTASWGREGAVVNAARRPMPLVVGAPDARAPPKRREPEQGETAVATPDAAPAATARDAGAQTAIAAITCTGAREARRTRLRSAVQAGRVLAVEDRPRQRTATGASAGVAAEVVGSGTPNTRASGVAAS